MLSPTTQKELNAKFILFDTSIVSVLLRYDQEFVPFLTDLINANTSFCINEFVWLEWIRVARDTKTKNEIEAFLSQHFTSLPAANIYGDAKELYPLYNFCQLVKSKAQVSLADAMNVAFMKHYSATLFFVTLDHSDYPLEMLDRIETGTVDVKSKIITWGIYRFNSESYANLLKNFK